MTAKYTPLVKIAAARAIAGISQEELAKRSGICTQAIAFYENGKTSPTVANLQKIASVLNCDIKDLI